MTMDLSFIDNDSPPVEKQDTIDSKTQQRYRIFKKNSPFLYDYILTSPLLWPSLTVLFFPDLELLQSPNQPNGTARTVSQRLLLGTFTSGQAIDAISIDLFEYHDKLNESMNTDQWNYNQERQEFELTTVSRSKLLRLQTIHHDGDINKLIYMPQNPDVIASVNNTGDLLIFNRTKHSTLKKNSSNAKANEPQLRLVSDNIASSEMFAVDWNIQKEGLIVSGSMNGSLNVHDIRENYNSKEANCIRLFWSRNDSESINDVRWVPDHDSIFVSGDDLGVIALTDIRSGILALESHNSGISVNSVSINPMDTYCFASGNSEGRIELWDLRNFKSHIAQISSHTDAITQLKWHPKFKCVLGSSSADRLVRVFNLASSSKQQLLFNHEGHMLGVNDFDWSKHIDWMIASVADDNSVHVWHPAKHLLPVFY